MQMHSAGPDYESIVGAIHAFRRASQGAPPGDPDLAARILVALAGADELPLCLPLGAGAVDRIRGNERRRIAELEQWADLSRQADFPSA